ncbi:MAG: hypothetical protein RLZZ563_1644 [Pseudomonadota bacterium]
MTGALDGVRLYPSYVQVIRFVTGNLLCAGRVGAIC